MAIPNPDKHPNRRVEDRGNFLQRFAHARFYRDIWLIIVTGLVFVALSNNQDRVDDIQASRVEQSTSNCKRQNDLIDGVNDGTVTLATLVVQATIQPGDQPVPRNEPDPFKWTDIKPGPLSQQLSRLIPGFPSAQDRLRTAQVQSKVLQGKRLSHRDCSRKAILKTIVPPAVPEDSGG